MAITISGENNNDKILATDGVIDSLSGFNIVGVITATTFTGDLTGDVTGNLTGNVTGNINNSTLLLQTGGNERVRIDSNGKVGVGVNPSAYPGKFVVSGDALICDRDIHSRVANSVANSDRGFKQDTDGVEKLHLYADNSSNIILEGNSGVEKFRIDSAGRVIIANGGNGGTADINADNFVVKNYNSSSSGGISILNADNQNSTLYFGNASDSKHAEIVWSDAANLFLIGSSNSGASLKFRTANQSDALIIDSAGLIKTLTRSAEVRRMILSGSPTNTAFNIEAHDGETGTSSGDVQGKLGLFYNDGSTLTNTACISFIRGSSAADGAMDFVTNQTVRLHIDSSGKIGISRTPTQHPLEIQHASEPTVSLWRGTTKSAALQAQSGGTYLYSYENAPLIFSVNSASGFTERLRITNTGRINIGDTDQTQNVDQLSVTVAAQNAIDNVARFQSNAAASGTSETLVKIYKGAGYGGVLSGYITQGSDHGLKFYTADSGTLSERLRINSTGRLLLGTVKTYGTGPYYDDICINNSNGSGSAGGAGIDLISKSDNYGAIVFSNESQHERGYVKFEHNSGVNKLRFGTLGTDRMIIDSTGNMGLGLSPAYSGLFGGAQRTFQIGGTAAPCLRITSSSSGQADLVVHAGNSGRRADIANMATNGAISIWTKPSSGSIAERIKISSAGYVTKPATPAFFATHTNASSTIIGTLTYNTSGNGYYNNGGHLDVSSGRFHAPVDGIYHFHFHGFFQSGQNNNYYEVIMYRRNSNGSGALGLTRQYGYRDQATNQYGPSISMQCTCSLTAGQTVEVSTGGLSFHGANGWYFGGHLLG